MPVSQGYMSAFGRLLEDDVESSTEDAARVLTLRPRVITGCESNNDVRADMEPRDGGSFSYNEWTLGTAQVYSRYCTTVGRAA